MSNAASLQSIADEIASKGYISFGDVRRLQRDILPDSIAGQTEAECLIALDRRVSRVNPAWSCWLVAAVVDVVVWTERPTGLVSEETAQWLATALRGDGVTTSRTARTILRRDRPRGGRL